MAIVGIDLDSTLNTFLEHWLTKYNAKYVDNLTPADITDWDVASFTKPECGEKIFSLLAEDDFYLGVMPRQGVTEGVYRLVEADHDCYIITAYHPNMMRSKVEWIKHYLPFFDVKNIMFVNNKKLVHLDMLIDDGLHNFSALHRLKVVAATPSNAKGLGYGSVYDYILREWKSKDVTILLNMLDEVDETYSL